MILSKHFYRWVLFIFLSVLSAGISYKYMDQVFSFINVSITKDRQEILDQALELAKELHWDIENYHNVVSFDSQDDLQCFVELEAGGKEAFVEMFKSGNYYPFYWRVRFFKEKEIFEMDVWFSPEGKKLGFAQKIPEQMPGKALTKDQAQTLVEQNIEDWYPNFPTYKLIEYDSEIRDTGRIDHNFTYERTDIALGKGFYRLSAVVSGDNITRLEPTVKIPDNFIRRYQQMRSANNLLALVGSLFLSFLYVLLFGLFGLIFFYRRNYLLPKSSAIASLFVAGGMFLRGFNNYPLWWLSYNTVQSSFTFILLKLFQQLMVFVYFFSIIFLTLIVAEAASRFVYKKHLQFFKICSWQALGSYEVLHQIFFGYLCVPFFLLYGICFSYLMKTYFGWWSPASSLFDPNIVASYFPWFGALSISLYAGFFEEIVCRALPFAMTATLAADSKHKRFWFIVIFIGQALIFGAVHANYPNQPCYARLIELLPISFMFGWIYLKFGLLPGIITHFVYDVIWFAMPIFTSNLFWSKVMVVFFTGLPLWISLAVYAFHKKLYNLPAAYFNEFFVAPEPISFPVQSRKIGEKIPVLHIKMITILGVLGFVIWVMTNKFQADTFPLRITKSQAIEIARKAIKDKFGSVLDRSWTVVAINQDDVSSISTRFIWQKYGKDIYDLAQGSYVSGVNWYVSFLKFQGAVEDRGEEYQVVISSSHLEKHANRKPLPAHEGHITKAIHKLPEHFIGKDIDQQQAEKIAYDFIAQEYFITQDDLNLVSVNSDKLENRRDWTIVFQDTQIFDFSLGGQARIKIGISGDKVTSFSRFIFVPEDWDRSEQERLMNISFFKMILLFLMFALLFISSIFAVIKLALSNFGKKVFKHKAFFIGIVSFVYALNGIALSLASFNTAEPFYYQVVRLVLSMFSVMSLQVAFYSILLSAGAVGFVRGQQPKFLQGLLLAIPTAWTIIGANSLINFYQPHLQPVVGCYAPSAYLVSFLAFSTECLKQFYVLLALMVGMFIVLNAIKRYTSSWLLELLTPVLFFVGFESLQVGPSVFSMLLHAFVIGIVVYAVYYLILQYDMTLLPLVCGIIMISMVVPELLFPAYCGASLDGLIAIAVIAISSFFFHDRFYIE